MLGAQIIQNQIIYQCRQGCLSNILRIKNLLKKTKLLNT
jgi:hypothetical protein